MPADFLTKSDYSKTNDAVSFLLCTGTMCFSPEAVETQRRAGNLKERTDRTKSASRRRLREA